MITGQMKSRIDKLWTEFWTGGITNPLTVIEQISYLMFAPDARPAREPQ
jgi:type I restriction enzyme M protein